MPLLQSFMEVLERETGMHMSFDDLTGFKGGFHEDVSLLNLDWQHQLHCCDFCEFAKIQPRGLADCVRNKLAVNRVAIRRQRGLEGHCRLGLFDIVEPLIHGDCVLGIFYYGSVAVRERLELTRAKILRQCKRREQDPGPYLEALARATVISEDSIPRHREALRTVVRLAKYFCESSGVQQELYRRRKLTYPYVDPERYPHVVRATIRYVREHIDQPFIVKDIANHIGCHPDFLSRRFKQHTRMELSAYLKQVRVDHAKQLLKNSKIDIGTASELAGFSNRVHFSKVFRRLTGMTPGKYQQQCGEGE
jgi:AraC-like DNA-binding protein